MVPAAAARGRYAKLVRLVDLRPLGMVIGGQGCEQDNVPRGARRDPDLTKPSSSHMAIPWTEVEAILHRDPGARGLATYCQRNALDAGQLRLAAESLTRHGTTVCVVTGFRIPDATPPAAETDGPHGALALARALMALGMRVSLATDAYAMPLLRAGLNAWRLEEVSLLECPFDGDPRDESARGSNLAADCARTDAWIDSILSRETRDWSHLVAIERVGPSHTVESLLAQPRSGSPPVADFERLVPPVDRDVSHNMRGARVQAHAAKLHRLFEAVAREKPSITTIGIGDGGNEVGMGSFAWETLVEALDEGVGGRIACRVATNHSIVAGVSNWGGYALALATLALAGRAELARDWTIAQDAALVETLVDHGAVDGVTLRREASVDGLSLPRYLPVLADLRQAFGLPR